MSNKKKPSFAKILLMVLGTSIWWIILVLIPAGIQIYQFFGGDIDMLNQLPSWVWFVPLLIYIVYVSVKTVSEYKKEPEIYQNTSSVERNSASKNLGISSSNQGGGFAGNNAGQVFKGDVHYHERENIPFKFYIPKQTELKNKINIETLNLQRELRTFGFLSGEHKGKQLEVVLDVAMNIWKNLLNPAKVILGDTPIPTLIDDIYTQLTRYRGNWELLQGQNDTKNNWLGAVKTSHPEIIVVNKRIVELETELNQLWNNIETKINLAT